MNFNLKNGIGDRTWGHINLDEVADIRIFSYLSSEDVTIIVELKNGTEFRIGSDGEKKVVEWDRPTQTATHHKLDKALLKEVVVKEFTNHLEVVNELT